jgi:hypothetical protein
VIRTENNYREPFGISISESWTIWDIQINHLKKRNDLLADADEMPETGNSPGEIESSPNNESQDSGQ